MEVEHQFIDMSKEDITWRGGRVSNNIKEFQELFQSASGKNESIKHKFVRNHAVGVTQISSKFYIHSLVEFLHMSCKTTNLSREVSIS